MKRLRKTSKVQETAMAATALTLTEVNVDAAGGGKQEKIVHDKNNLIKDTKLYASSHADGAVSSISTGSSDGGIGGNAKPKCPQLNPEVFKNFEKQGKSEFLKYLKQQLKDNNNPVLDKNREFKVGIPNAIYELLWQGIRCTLKKETVLLTLTDVVAMHTDFNSIILDVINILDNETSLMTDGIQEERLMFVQIVKDLDKVIAENLIKERLDIDTLQEVGIVKNKTFYTKFIKVKTKLYYKQRRFNLFREESEGYAKLITELNQNFEENVSPDNLMDIMKSLIGCFNLDPNRVLDIILESFEMHSERWKLFIPLLRTYMPTSSVICEVLGHKFYYFKETRAPKSLYNVCALLLKHNVIELDDIYAWLTPTDTVITNDWNQELNEAQEFARKFNVIAINKDKEQSDPEVAKSYDQAKYDINQKFGLCQSLLEIGDWENALKIINKLPEQCVVVHNAIADALAELLHFTIEHVYYNKAFKASGSHKPRPKPIFSEDAALVKELQARHFKDLPKYAFPMIVALGPSMYRDTILMYRVIRIMRAIIIDMGVDTLNPPPPNSDIEFLYYEIIDCMDSCILPALSYLDSNSPMAEELWTVLKYYPYHFRYSLYARWKNMSYLLHPSLIRRRASSLKAIKALMKRVSKENVKQMGRSLGKYSHCAPGIFFEYILLQIQIYDNLIGPVVDTFKYLTSLSFDCLGYCIIEALTRADRDRFKHDGTSISLWLQALAAFCGAVYKKYNIELSGLLQYVANQLKSQKSLDLLILREIVQKMAGVESAEEMTNEQLQAMCGGELLRGEAGYFSQVRNTKKSSMRLKDSLANNDLAVTLCLLMAQQKHCVIYRETAKSHLKLVGKLYDQCQDTLVQFGTFLGSTYSVDEYVERLPSIIAMLQEYHINADVAFFLARPMFTHQINQKYDQLRKADPNAKKLTTAQKMQKYLEATNLIMNPIVESVRPLHSCKVWEDISPQFLVTFWSLSMYDLQVPVESYQREINKLKQLSVQAIDSKNSNDSKNKKEQERYIALMEKLNDERKKQQEHVDKIQQRLQQHKDSWFLSRSAKSAKNDTITQFLQLCLFPRCTFTALDALYCAKFVHIIHNLKTSNFSTLLCYDRIFCDITYSVTSCTENEATRYGRFLCAMLETVMRWHSDQAVFNKECANYPGFVTKFRVSNQFSEANDHVGYENYRHVCHKWHYKITKAIVFCLDSKEYMQIRNALIILMRVLPHYPILSKLAQIIERKVEKVREEEKNKRPDLFAIASSYIGQLKMKTPTLLKESDFHQVSERPNKEEGKGGVASSALKQESGVNESKSVKQEQNGDIKSEIKDERVESKSKIIKLNPSAGNSSSTPNSNYDLRTNSSGIKNENSGRSSNLTIIEIKEDVSSALHHDRDNDRHSSNVTSTSTGRALRESIKKEKEREERLRERGAGHRSNDELDSISLSSQRTTKRDKRREERREERHHRHMHADDMIEMSSTSDRHNDLLYEMRNREIRDLSSVSNESNGSLQQQPQQQQQQHRRSHERIEYDTKESKRRKLETASSSVKKQVDELVDSVKKARNLKLKSERRDKLTDEEKDARKERKLGRKRDRLDEATNVEHKRRRDLLNGDEETRERDKYALREKMPRERSHDKFERERGSTGRNMGGSVERQYGNSSKSGRSRNAY